MPGNGIFGLEEMTGPKLKGGGVRLVNGGGGEARVRFKGRLRGG